MRRLPLSDVRPGMALARAVHNSRGDILVRPGVGLTERVIDALRQMGFVNVLIHDPDTDDIEIADVLTERVRATVTSDICRLHEAVRANSSEQAFDAESVRQLVGDVVDDVLAAPAAIAMATMRGHDTYEFDHAIDGTAVAILIARQLRWDLGTIRRLAAGCLLRDVGMVTIDREVVRRPGPLTPSEWSEVRAHPENGYKLLRSLRPNDVIANHVAYQHHERPDGLGYPRGLRDDNTLRHAIGTDSVIPDAAIAAAADFYDALTTDRPFRAAFPPDRIVTELRAMAGSHLNREAVAALLAILPTYPVGCDVLVRDGVAAGWRGIVVSVNPQRLDRPVVRLLINPRGQRVQPREFDLSLQPATLTALLPGQGSTPSAA